MKKAVLIIFIVLGFEFKSNAQISINGLQPIVYGGSVSPTPPTPPPPIVSQDTTAKIINYAPIINDEFDATRPNKKVYVTGPLAFNENYTIPGYSGTVTIINTGGWPVTFNGVFSGTIPIISFVAHYSNTGGTITWN